MNPHTQKMPNVHLINNIPQTDSLNVASVFGRLHKDVLNSIKQLDCSEGFRERNFSLSSYPSEQNKTMPKYEMTFDGFIFLVMGFTGAKAAAFKETYIARFNEMFLNQKDQRNEKYIAALESENGLLKENIQLRKNLGIKGTPVSDAEKDEIHRLFDEELCKAEVARLTGRSRDTIRRVLAA